MKLIRFTLLFFLAVLRVDAQDVLTAAANLPQAGDSIPRRQVEYFPPGNSGENQIWDFSELQACDEETFIRFSCDSDSLVLFASAPERVLKYKTGCDSLILRGYETRLLRMDYQPALLQVPFPFSFGDYSSHDYRGNGVYCTKYILDSNGTVENEADASGVICLSGPDTLRNVLRVHQVQTSAIRQYLPGDTLFNAQGSRLRIEEHYLWFARGFRYPVFETISLMVFHDMVPVSCQQTAFCTLPSEQQHLRDSVNNRILQADSLEQANTPRPPIIHYSVSAEDGILTIRYALDADAAINVLVCDKMGMVHRRSSATGVAGSAETLRLSTSGLKAGVYILYMNVNGQVISEKVEL